ncbi:MAG TPA: class I SAM-dependent methyltransferase [Gemmatimonadota bacterium]|nr:class I SAM-dependent methyltransferase [Gemmatimonadota bacterium]
MTEHPGKRVFFESYSHYFDRADVVSEYASFEFLQPPEKRILEELRPRLPGARMLDVGVGAGRTTLHFAPLVREYVGIDLSPSMIEACRKRFSGTSWNVTFEIADIRDLGGFDSASFDFVLFSFNGIDTVGGLDDRSAALAEIHRVCRPGGLFCFSSTNLRFALFRASMFASLWRFLLSHPRTAVRHPKRLRRFIAESKRWKRLNPTLHTLAIQGGGLVVEDRSRFEFVEGFYESPRERIRVEKYYIMPRKQAEQLEAVGFRDLRTFGMDGHEVHGNGGGRLIPWWWLYYFSIRDSEPRGEVG